MVYLKFRDSSFLRRCNNAEYAYVGTKVISLVSATGLETLGIPEEFFTKYQARKAVLTNLVSMSRSSVETTKINEMEAKIDGLLKYMLRALLAKPGRIPLRRRKKLVWFCTMRLKCTWTSPNDLSNRSWKLSLDFCMISDNLIWPFMLILLV